MSAERATGGANGSRPVRRPRASPAEIAALDDAILAVLDEEHPATLRGVFYRVMSLGAVDKSETEYRRVGARALALRRSGAMPHSWIVDEGRSLKKVPTWSGVDEAIEHLLGTYRRSRWVDQPVDVHLYAEKDALSGVLAEVVGGLDLQFGATRGYASESFAWQVAQALPDDKRVHLLNLGDHDPSGVNAWHAFENRVREFRPEADLMFERLAVTPEQIEVLSLPTRPTKSTDSRAARFAGESVEVDAIAPRALRSIVTEAVGDLIDWPLWHETGAAEERDHDRLRDLLAG